MKHATETSTASQAPQSQFSLLTDGRQSKHLIERDDKEDEQQSLHNLDKEENAQEPWEKHLHPEADSREWLNKSRNGMT